MRNLTRSLQLFIVTLVAYGSANAQEKTLRVSVVDLQNRPIESIELTAGGSSPRPTNSQGHARIPLASETKPNEEVELLITSPPNKLVFISPWNSRVRVPPFTNSSANSVTIVLAERGIKDLLTDERALNAIANIVGNRWPLPQILEQSTEMRREAVLNKVAKEFDLKVDELTQALQEWSKKAKDPIERGKAALAAGNYTDAEELLSQSLKLREREAAESAYSLGIARFEQGKYPEAAEAFRKAVNLGKDDADALFGVGISLFQMKKIEEAKPFVSRCLALREKRVGPDHPDTAHARFILGSILAEQGRYADAESQVKHLWLIFEKSLGLKNIIVCDAFQFLADLYEKQKKYAELEQLYKQVLMVVEKQPDPDNDAIADLLDSVSQLYIKQGKHAEAKPLLERALKISKESDIYAHRKLYDLAEVYRALGEYSKAEPLYKSALKLAPDAFPFDGDLETVRVLLGLADLYHEQGDPAKAEPLYKRALGIAEQKIGKEEPVVASVLEHYVVMLRKLNRSKETAEYEERAKKIREILARKPED